MVSRYKRKVALSFNESLPNAKRATVALCTIVAPISGGRRGRVCVGVVALWVGLTWDLGPGTVVFL